MLRMAESPRWGHMRSSWPLGGATTVYSKRLLATRIDDGPIISEIKLTLIHLSSKILNAKSSRRRIRAARIDEGRPIIRNQTCVHPSSKIMLIRFDIADVYV